MAYNGNLDYILCGETFTSPLSKGNTEFMSTYSKKLTGAQKKLDTYREAYQSAGN